MLLLQSHKLFRQLAEYDIDTGSFNERLKNLHEEEKTKGFYGFLGKKLIMLYGIQSDIILELEGKRFIVGDNVYVNIQKTQFNNHIQIMQNQQVIFDCKYSRPILDPPLDESFTMSEEEDFDFGVFLRSVINDKARLDRLCEIWRLG